MTPVPTGVAKPLVGSLLHEVVCAEHDLDDLVGAAARRPAVVRPGRGRRHRRRPRATPARNRARSTPRTSRAPTLPGPAIAGAAGREPEPPDEPGHRAARLRARRAGRPGPARPHRAGLRRSTAAGSSPSSPCWSAPSSLAWALRIEPGDPTFYVATFALAAVWAVGAFASGPLHLGRGHTRGGQDVQPRGRAVPRPRGLLLGLFMAGAVVVAQVPAPARPRPGAARPRPVRLARARHASSPSSTASPRSSTSGAPCTPRSVAGTPWPSPRSSTRWSRRRPASRCWPSRRPLVGLVVAFQRRVTGGILGPVITHLTWSLGMLFLLPPVLDRLS